MSSYDTQVGGDHYKDMKIQPSEFINKNKMQFAEGNAIKYICRHQKKGGKQDLEKAKHYIDMIIERDYGDDAYRSQTFEVSLPNDLSISYGDVDNSFENERETKWENNMTYDELQKKVSKLLEDTEDKMTNLIEEYNESIEDKEDENEIDTVDLHNVFDPLNDYIEDYTQ